MKILGYEIIKVIPEPDEDKAEIYKLNAEKYSDLQEASLVWIFSLLFITLGSLVAFAFDIANDLSSPPSGAATLLFAVISAFGLFLYYFSKNRESYWFKQYWKAKYPEHQQKREEE